ncbi:MAG: S1 family peptidase [Polyangiaceae bacterium]
MAKAKKRVGFVWLLCGLGALSACSASASSAEDSAARQEPISGGSTDAANTNVFSVLIHADGAVGACSATLIAENLLLTARHCVAPGGEDPVVCGRASFGDAYAPSGMIAANAVDVTRTQTWYHGSEVFVPSEGSDTCGFDIALIVLKERIPATVAAPAVPRIDRDVTIGEAYEAVGYGTSEVSDYGVRRLLENQAVLCEPGACRSGVIGSEFVGSTGACEGDSGGPAFAVDGKLVGVASRSAEDCSTPVYSSLPGWKDFIVETARHAASVGGYEPPFWVTTGKSDPPVVIPPPTPTLAVGETCGGDIACVDGAVCYQASSSAAPFCAATCESASDCAMGQQCIPLSASDSVCLAPNTHKASASCQFGPPRSTGALWFGVAFGLALLRRRALRS